MAKVAAAPREEGRPDREAGDAQLGAARALLYAVAVDIGQSGCLVQPYALRRWKEEIDQAIALIDACRAGHGAG
jgi:hypothetical protein